MIPPWASSYVGIPFKDRGRERDGLDCYGLLETVLREQFGVDIPSYAGAYASAKERDEVSALLEGRIPEDGWTLVTDPSAGDGVLFRLLNRPWHVGVMVDAQHFLHVEEGVGASCVERLDSYRWARRLLGVYRHAALVGARA